VPNDRISALENTVAKYQKTLEDLTVLHEELRRLPQSQRLNDVIELNQETLKTSRRLLETARIRLERERGVSAAPFAFETPVTESAACPALPTLSAAENAPAAGCG
jgi:hypothetical protein